MAGRKSDSEFRPELGSSRIRPSRAAMDFDECTELLRQLTRPMCGPAIAFPSGVPRWFRFRNPFGTVKSEAACTWAASEKYSKQPAIFSRFCIPGLAAGEHRSSK